MLTKSRINTMSNTKETPATLYNWSTAPDWAQWAAMDANGISCWYEQEPVMSNWADWWFAANGKHTVNEKRATLSVKWENSLEQRPKAQ